MPNPLGEFLSRFRRGASDDDPAPEPRQGSRTDRPFQDDDGVMQELVASAPPPRPLKNRSPRVRMLEDLWGVGNALPGDDEFILSLTRPLGLSEDMNLLDLHAGLGGAGRLLAQEFGVWVEGREPDEELAAHGMAASDLADMTRKAPVTAYNPEDLSLREEFYEAALCRELPYRVANKTAFLERMIGALAPRGELLITDYVVPRGAGGHSFLAWRQRERGTVTPWTVETYEDSLRDLRVDLRITQDMTKEIRRFVMRALAGYLKTLRRGDLDSDAGKLLLAEVERWAARVNAFDDGQLMVYRFFGVKRRVQRTLEDLD